MKRKIKYIAIACLLILIMIIHLFNLFFDNLTIVEVEKEFFGGVIKNNTNHIIKVANSMESLILEPGENSRQKGLFDADGIIIEHSTKFKTKLYDKGVIKFCDLARVTVVNGEETDEIRPNLMYYFCECFDDAGWVESREKAFTD